jgi:hypothetical protein
MKFALIALAVVLMAGHGYAFNNTITYCVDSNTLAINDTFDVCGNSPVLNPGNLNCQNYTRHMEEECASGCDPKTGACTPSPMERVTIIAAVFILVLAFIVYLARRYG